jgi:chromosomal replication initiation ATPase DnaA
MPAPSSQPEPCRQIGEVVALAFGVSPDALRGATRGPAPIAFARQVAMYLGHVALGLSLTRVGQGFGRDRTTARHACHRIENCRDDAAVDRLLADLEQCCTAAVARPQAQVRP